MRVDLPSRYLFVDPVQGTELFRLSLGEFLPLDVRVQALGKFGQLLLLQFDGPARLLAHTLVELLLVEFAPVYGGLHLRIAPQLLDGAFVKSSSRSGDWGRSRSGDWGRRRLEGRTGRRGSRKTG